MVQQRLQRLGDGKQLQEAVDDDVEDGQEAQAHVAKVDGQVLRLQLHGRVDLLRESLKVQLLGVFLGKKQQNTVDLRPGFLSIKSDGSSVARMYFYTFTSVLLRTLW